MANSVRDSVQRVLDGLGLNVSVKGRYGAEKLGVIGVWGVLCVLSLVWALSGTAKLENPIGAKVELHLISTSGEHWYTLRNTSDFEWTGIRLELNEAYVSERNTPLPAGDSDRFFTKDFRYLMYVPRTRRYAGPHRIAKDDAPGPTAKPDLRPTSLVIRTDQGAHRVVFTPAGAKPPAPDTGAP